MTKKDYELIASVIKKEYERATTLSEYHKKVNEPVSSSKWRGQADGAHQVALNLGFALAQDNNRFDKDKFYKACGIN